ncbi:MAG TPA: hypothetical protein DIU11_14545 [Pusillimonas sp.]|nr:hypothetical protein [Pusillimonas sp.]
MNALAGKEPAQHVCRLSKIAGHIGSKCLKRTGHPAHGLTLSSIGSIRIALSRSVALVLSRVLLRVSLA